MGRSVPNHRNNVQHNISNKNNPSYWKSGKPQHIRQHLQQQQQQQQQQQPPQQRPQQKQTTHKANRPKIEHQNTSETTHKPPVALSSRKFNQMMKAYEQMQCHNDEHLSQFWWSRRPHFVSNPRCLEYLATFPTSKAQSRVPKLHNNVLKLARFLFNTISSNSCVPDDINHVTKKINALLLELLSQHPQFSENEDDNAAQNVPADGSCPQLMPYPMLQSSHRQTVALDLETRSRLSVVVCQPLVFCFKIPLELSLTDLLPNVLQHPAIHCDENDILHMLGINTSDDVPDMVTLTNSVMFPSPINLLEILDNLFHHGKHGWISNISQNHIALQHMLQHADTPQVQYDIIGKNPSLLSLFPKQSPIDSFLHIVIRHSEISFLLDSERIFELFSILTALDEQFEMNIHTLLQSNQHYHQSSSSQHAIIPSPALLCACIAKAYIHITISHILDASKASWIPLRISESSMISFSVESGLVASISECLSKQQIGILSISTNDHEYIMVRDDTINTTLSALQQTFECQIQNLSHNHVLYFQELQHAIAVSKYFSRVSRKNENGPSHQVAQLTQSQPSSQSESLPTIDGPISLDIEDPYYSNSTTHSNNNNHNNSSFQLNNRIAASDIHDLPSTSSPHSNIADNSHIHRDTKQSHNPPNTLNSNLPSVAAPTPEATSLSSSSAATLPTDPTLLSKIQLRLLPHTLFLLPFAVYEMATVIWPRLRHGLRTYAPLCSSRRSFHPLIQQWYIEPYCPSLQQAPQAATRESAAPPCSTTTIFPTRHESFLSMCQAGGAVSLLVDADILSQLAYSENESTLASYSIESYFSLWNQWIGLSSSRNQFVSLLREQWAASFSLPFQPRHCNISENYDSHHNPIPLPTFESVISDELAHLPQQDLNNDETVELYHDSDTSHQLQCQFSIGSTSSDSDNDSILETEQPRLLPDGAHSLDPSCLTAECVSLHRCITSPIDEGYFFQNDVLTLTSLASATSDRYSSDNHVTQNNMLQQAKNNLYSIEHAFLPHRFVYDCIYRCRSILRNHTLLAADSLDFFRCCFDLPQLDDSASHITSSVPFLSSSQCSIPKVSTQTLPNLLQHVSSYSITPSSFHCHQIVQPFSHSSITIPYSSTSTSKYHTATHLAQRCIASLLHPSYPIHIYYGHPLSVAATPAILHHALIRHDDLLLLNWCHQILVSPSKVNLLRQIIGESSVEPIHGHQLSIQPNQPSLLNTSSHHFPHLKFLQRAEPPAWSGRSWICFELEGQWDTTCIGVVALLSQVVTKQKLCPLYCSSFVTDYLCVPHYGAFTALALLAMQFPINFSKIMNE